MNKILPWKELKKILTEDWEVSDLMLGSNKSDNTGFDSKHCSWNGTKKELTNYISESKKNQAVEVFIYHKSDNRYFYTIWNELEGYLF